MKVSLEETKPKIVLAGDSWGCGEWNLPYQSPKILHKGLEQFFIDQGYEVKNLSKPAGSNNQAINALQSHSLENSTVIFIQTDPFRDLTVNELTTRINAAGSVKNLVLSLLDDTYNKLNALPVKIHLIGGLFNINSTLVNNYSNLKILLSSWINLLVKQYPEYSHTANENYGALNIHNSFNDIDLSTLNINIAGSVIDEFYSYEKNLDVFKEDIFHPDGCHPNRNGHKLLFNYILKELNL